MSDNTPQNKRPYSLSLEEKQELESHLVQNPDDFDARRRLLIEYDLEAWHSPEARESHHRHVFWIIQNHPESELAGAPYMLIRDSANTEANEKAQRLWLQQIEAHPVNADVLGHAAQFFLYTVPQQWSKVKEWLQKAMALAPNNPEWPQHLGRLYEFQRRRGTAEESRRYAQEALLHYENAYELTAGEEEKILLLDDLARNAVEAEEFDKAKDYATRLLTGAPICERGTHVWFPGNAIHWGHIVLGRVALHHKDVEAAKMHLLSAGQTPGSPQLNSFGPDVVLAKQLLEQGQTEAVLTYLKTCANFWQHGQQELAQWVSAVRQNRIPDFGDHLRRR